MAVLAKMVGQVNGEFFSELENLYYTPNPTVLKAATILTRARVWDIVSLTYAKVASHAAQPTSALPWIDGAGGEDQV